MSKEVSEGTSYEKVLEILDINQETILILKEGLQKKDFKRRTSRSI
jgi:DNA-binding CsgD family transcriptional regulator